MQQHRIISLLSILVMLIIPVIGWFLVAQPQLSAAASADQQRADAAAQVVASQAVVDQLKADAEKLPQLRDELDELRRSIPAGADPSGWIDGLSALARVSKVEIVGLSVTDPVAYTPASPPVQADASSPADGAADGSTESDSTGQAPVEQAPPPVAHPGIVTNPLVDASNFVAIPVTVDVEGTTASILRFVNGLQTGSRLFLVTSFSTEPGTDPKQLSGKIGGFIWAIPTGDPGDPRPVSTMVKSMEPAESENDETETETGTEATEGGADGTSDQLPTPDPADTPAP